MKKKVAGRLAAIGAAMLGAALVSTPAAAQKIDNSYICVFKKDAVAKSAVGRKASELARGNGGTVSRTYSNTIRAFSARISAQGAARIAANNANIAFCEQDQVMSTGQRGKPGGGGGTAPAATNSLPRRSTFRLTIASSRALPRHGMAAAIRAPRLVSSQKAR